MSKNEGKEATAVNEVNIAQERETKVEDVSNTQR